MADMDILWEQMWLDPDERLLMLRCVMVEHTMRFEVINPTLEDRVEATFDHYDQARAYLRRENFQHDTRHELEPRPGQHRLSPQRKKQLSYRRDARTLPNGRGASRRTKSLLPKLRRRQLRRRMKAYLQRQLKTIFREVSDQSLRSIRADDLPQFGETVALKDALQEKKRRRSKNEKSTRPYTPDAEDKPRRRRKRRRDNDLPDWLRS